MFTYLRFSFQIYRFESLLEFWVEKRERHWRRRWRRNKTYFCKSRALKGLWSPVIQNLVLSFLLSSHCKKTISQDPYTILNVHIMSSLYFTNSVIFDSQFKYRHRLLIYLYLNPVHKVMSNSCGLVVKSGTWFNCETNLLSSCSSELLSFLQT